MSTTVQGLAPGPADVDAAATPRPSTPRPGATRTTPQRTTERTSSDGAPSDGSPSDGTPTDHALLVVMALVWGVNFSVLKIGTRYLDPATFNGVRVLLATLVLGVVAAVRAAPSPGRADAIRLILLGVLGHGVYQYFFIEGLARSETGTTALILAASPAFIGIIGRVIGDERLGGRAWAAVGLQLAGMAGVVFGSAALGGPAAAGASARSSAGVLYILAAALTWAVYAVLLKPYTRRLDGVQIAAWTLVGGALTLGASTLPAIARGALAALPAVGWAAMAYSAVLALALSYVFYYRGVRALGPVRTAMYGNLQPVVALGVGFTLLGERPGAWQLAGAALIGLGLVAAARPTRARA